jgi:hypothetical protein
MATDQERAVFDQKMAQWQDRLDRYEATKDPRLILETQVIAEVRTLPDYATGSATWNDAQHVVGWSHWLRYQALGDRRGAADRQAAEGCFRTTSRTRPSDIPQSLWQQYDMELQKIYDDAMGVIRQEGQRRRPRWRSLQGYVETLEIVCNLTSRGHPQYFERLDARAQLAQLVNYQLADSYRREGREARTQKGGQPPSANPPWRPFDWPMYLGM